MAPVSRPALAFAIAYFVCGLLGPEAFPFTRVPMYSGVGKGGVRRQADVPMFLVDGKSASIFHYHDFFSDQSTDDIIPWYHCRRGGECKALACSMGYVPEDAVRWIHDHQVPERAPDAVAVSYAYLHLDTLDDGTVTRRLDTVWTGTARPW